MYDPRLPTKKLNDFIYKIKRIINPIFYLYKIFGFKKFYSMKSNSITKKKAFNYYKKNLNFKNKSQILNLKIYNIYIGDLLYDEYIRTYNKPTITFEKVDSNEFENYLIYFLEAFFYWYDFFKTNKKVKSLIISHTTYAKGIAPRIAVHKGIKVFCVGNQVSTLISKKNLYKFDDTKYFKKTFNAIKPKDKKIFLKIGKESIMRRILGKNDKKLILDRTTDSKVFNTESKRDVFKKNGKTRILVATHCFTDAVHFYGKCLFPDFYEWIDHLGKLSNKLNYDWYIKLHPAQFENNKKHFEYFKRKYKKFKFLPQETINNDIFREKVDAVITVFGSAGHEYPLFGIPVINASKVGPHHNYNFNYYPKTIDHYTHLIKNVKKLKVNKKKIEKEIYEFVYMNFESNFEILENFEKTLFNLKNDYSSPLLFREYLKNYNEKKNKKINRKILNFIKSNKIKHYKFDSINK